MGLDPKGRIPIRPLDYTEAVEGHGYLKELCADYTPNEVALYVVDANGDVVNVTCSADMIISDIVDFITDSEYSDIILSNIHVDIANGDGTTTRKGLSDALNECVSEHRTQNTEFNTIYQNMQDTISDFTSEANSFKTQIENEIAFIKSNTDPAAIDSLREILDLLAESKQEIFSSYSGHSCITNSFVDMLFSATDKTVSGSAVNYLQYLMKQAGFITFDQVMVDTRDITAVSNIPANVKYYIQLEA